MDENFVVSAERNVEAEVQAGIARARVLSPIPHGFVGFCKCGVRVPELRVSLGYHRCVECQSSIENGGRR